MFHTTAPLYKTLRRVAGILVIAAVSASAQTFHAADITRDGKIGLGELLRLVQFYNADGYQCATDTEDGYGPGPGDTACAPHTADYDPADWRINLSELLRGVQHFNSDGYVEDCASEDGFGFGAPNPCVTEGEAESEEEGEGTAEGEGGPGGGEGALGGEGEGAPEGDGEGMTEGGGEGAPEGDPEGSQEGEGSPEGAPEGEGDTEGSLEGEGGCGIVNLSECAECCTLSCDATALNVSPAETLTSVYNLISSLSSELNFPPDTTDLDENGIVDVAHLLLAEGILNNPAALNHCCVRAAYDANLLVVDAYVEELKTDPIGQLILALVDEVEIEVLLTCFGTIGDPNTLPAFEGFIGQLGEFSLPDADEIDFSAGQYLAAFGDGDLDGVCNLAEYAAQVAVTPEDFPDFVAAALNAGIALGAGDCPDCFTGPEGEPGGEGEGVAEGEGEGEGVNEGEQGCPGLCDDRDWSDGCSPEDPLPVQDWWAGENTTDVTFIAFGDSQMPSGSDDKDALNIRAMNAVTNLVWDEGTFGFGGSVANVRGVILAGDVTQDGRDGRYGTEDNIGQFVSHYGLCGNRMLQYPVYEGYGNHDYFVYDHIGYRLPEAHPNVDAIAYRNPYRSGLTNVAPDLDGHYSWDWDNVHFVQLNLKPSDVVPNHAVPGANDPRDALTFLQADLAANVAGTNKRVIIITHYGFYSSWDFASWWTRDEADDYLEAIADYDVIAHIHGHAHQTGVYTYKGLQAFNVGSPYYAVHNWNPDGRGHFAIFRVTDTHIYVGDVGWNPEDPENDMIFPKNWSRVIELAPIGDEGEGDGGAP
jgi:cytolysin (calcineurin-like family phosphatase)